MSLKQLVNIQVALAIQIMMDLFVVKQSMELKH